MGKYQETLILQCVYLCLYMWAYLEILLNVNLFEQIAVTAGEELLTSMSAFEKSHCLVQDVTISQCDSFMGVEYILSNLLNLKENYLEKTKEQGWNFHL